MASSDKDQACFVKNDHINSEVNPTLNVSKGSLKSTEENCDSSVDDKVLDTCIKLSHLDGISPEVISKSSEHQHF